MFISPFCIFCLVYCNCFGHLFILHLCHFQGIWKVGKFVPVIIVSALFLNAQVLGLRKGEDIGLVRLFIHKLMREVGKLMSLQVEDGYSISISAGLGEDYLCCVKHAHRVHRYLEDVFIENGSVFMDMQDSIFAVTEQSQEDKGLIARSVQVQYLSILFGHLDLKMFSQYHKILLSYVLPSQSNQCVIQKYFLLLNFSPIIEMSSQFHYLLKFIVVGDSGVGKSCVVLQFIQQRMNQTHEVTLGVEFASRTISVKNKNIKFQVWDTAGQENFRSITRSYYRSAIGALLVYDITKRRSFEHLVEWLKEIRLNGNSQLEIIIIGNKTDLQFQREVSEQEGRKFANDNNLQWIELTAKDYSKVETAFIKVANNIIARIEQGQITETTPGIKMCLDQQINPLIGKKKSCC